MSPDRQRHPVPRFLVRHRAMLAMAIILMFTTAGTAAAVSYLVLGAVNTATTTTAIRSGVDGAVLQLTNNNTVGDNNARGLGINVPAGQPPIKVNATAGKATNLNADKLDDLEGAAFARGPGVTVVSNRLVLSAGQENVLLLTLPGLGMLAASCFGASVPGVATSYWKNTTSANVDLWHTFSSPDDEFRAQIVPPGDAVTLAYWIGTGQDGGTLILGQGNSPGALRTATVTGGAYRTSASAPCGIQATATIWSTP